MLWKTLEAEDMGDSFRVDIIEEARYVEEQ